MPHDQPEAPSLEPRIDALVARMTLVQKLGQLNQLNAAGGHIPEHLREAIAGGRVGSVLNEVDVATVNELQRIAVEDSELGIPLLVGRDVIHGFRTVLPIPLGLAATWNPALVQEGAQVAAREAAACGINWTFAPMIDVARDPRWGRIAESLGEDPYLASALAVAMVRGFQGEDPAAAGTIAACAKHFAGYGAVESGRDYATTNIPENELRNVYLAPFHAAIKAGVLTLMTSFSDLDGVPATANDFLLRKVLREEWGFDGLVVSDWDSVRQLAIHGLTEDDKASALAAASAGVDMEMVGESFLHHLPALLDEGHIDIARIDAMVRNILRVKFRLGLFERPYGHTAPLPPEADRHALRTARDAALQSAVLLRNEHNVLPLVPERLSAVAVIGPLADAPYEQLGTWIFDGDVGLSVTPLTALRALAGERFEVRYAPAMQTSRSRVSADFDEAVAVARDCDVVVLFLGEEAILSGEAHSRADIDLPGDQVELVRRMRALGKPVVAVILAGRPLTLANIVEEVDALLFAWHPGSMAGPALADLLLGIESPSGKLPASFPRMVGQIPVHYNQKNTGKPPTPSTTVHIDDIDAQAPQTSIGMTAFHLDAGYRPLFEFGFGLSYARFEYAHIATDATQIRPGDTLRVSAQLTNHGDVAADEVAQLYVRDRVGSVTRPVRELKGFQRVRVAPGETLTVAFELHTDALAFYGRDMTRRSEAGLFDVWIGGSSQAQLHTQFRLL